MNINEDQFKTQQQLLLELQSREHAKNEQRKQEDRKFLKEHVSKSGEDRWAVKDSDWEVVREPKQLPGGHLEGVSKRQKEQRNYGLFSRTTGKPPKAINYGGAVYGHKTVVSAAREAKRTPHEID